MEGSTEDLYSSCSEEELVPPFTLQEKIWKYRGEGNENLVLSIPEELKIVRFRKQCEYGSVDVLDQKMRVWREERFCRRVMKKLLGSAYVQSPAVCNMDIDELRELDRVLQDHRPEYRLHKSLVFNRVMIYPDHALIPPPPMGMDINSPTFCIEIKPKQGWIPLPDRRYNKCTYCLTQYLKLKKKTIEYMSNYCPLDLFSGDLARMKMAIFALTENPQNNMKVFKDGVLVYGDGCDGTDKENLLKDMFPGDEDLNRSEEKFCDLAAQALTLNLSNHEIYSCEELPITQWPPVPPPNIQRLPQGVLDNATKVLFSVPACNWAHQPLTQGSILERILYVQHMECDGADKVFDDYLKLSSREDFDYVDDIIDLQSLNSLHRYLLATTVKDCSVMMSFRHAPKGDNNTLNIVQDLDGKDYEVSVGVTDLDPKPICCIEKHRKRDHEVLLACVHFLAGKTEGRS